MRLELNITIDERTKEFLLSFTIFQVVFLFVMALILPYYI